MAFRSFVRDVIVIYLTYEIIKGYLYHNPSISLSMLLAALLLLIMTLWFLLERIGALPSFSSD